MQPKSLISAEAKKSPIKDVLNYLNDIQQFIAYFHKYDWLCHLDTIIILVQKNGQKRCTHKNVIDGRKHFIRRLRKTGENDWDKLRDNVSGHNEGTICLVNG